MKPIIRDVIEHNEAYLIYQLTRRFTRLFDDKARKMGFTRTQWKLLRTLHRHPGMRQTDLADLMDIAPMSLVHLLNRMEKKKWCRPVEDHADRRVKRVFLTPKVNQQSRKMGELSVNLRKTALKGFSKRDHETLVAFLQQMYDNLGLSDDTPIGRSEHE